jgi:hypothetical protein
LNALFETISPLLTLAGIPIVESFTHLFLQSISCVNQIRGDGVGAFLSAIQADVDASAPPAQAAPTTANGNTVEEKENDDNADTKMDEA